MFHASFPEKKLFFLFIFRDLVPDAREKADDAETDFVP